MKFIQSLLMGAVIAGAPLAIMPAFAQDMAQALKALDDALPGTLIHNPLDMEWDKRGNDIKTKVVEAEALPSGMAISVKMKKKQPKPWDSALSVKLPGEVQKGETVKVHFWVRTDRPATGRDTGSVSLFIGRDAEPYDSILVEDIYPSTEWKLVSASAVAESSFSENSLKAEYQMGRAKQTVEVGPVYVSNLGVQAP